MATSRVNASDPFDDDAATVSSTGEIVVTAIVARIPYGPTGYGSPLEAAFTAAAKYVSEAISNRDPWDCEAAFSYDGNEFLVSGHSVANR